MAQKVPASRVRKASSAKATSRKAKVTSRKAKATPAAKPKAKAGAKHRPTSLGRASGSDDLDLAAIDAAAATILAAPDERARRDRLRELLGPETRRFHVVGKTWSPYPKRLLRDLTQTDREVLRRLVEWRLTTGDEIHTGLVGGKDGLRRFLGLDPAGPSDAEITLEARTVPSWWAISTAAAGHVDARHVLAALERLPGSTRRAIVREVATGGAYDLLVAQDLTFKDAGIPRTPAKVKYWTLLFGLLADLATSLDGENCAAEELLVDVPDYGGSARVLVALLALTRAAPPIAPAHDDVLAALPARCKRDYIFAEPVVAELFAALPPARRAAIQARAEV